MADEEAGWTKVQGRKRTKSGHIATMVARPAGVGNKGVQGQGGRAPINDKQRPNAAIKRPTKMVFAKGAGPASWADICASKSKAEESYSLEFHAPEKEGRRPKGGRRLRSQIWR